MDRDASLSVLQLNTMTQTAYRGRPVRSPYQPARKPEAKPEPKRYDFSDPQHPVRQEIRRLSGTIALEATFAEDTAALAAMKHIPGTLAVICTLRKEGQIVGVGHGAAHMNRMNRNIERSVHMAMNGAFLSAANGATKVFDSLRVAAYDQERSRQLGEAYRPNLGPSEPATDKQKSYLRQLVSLRVDESEWEQWQSQIDSFDREEASDAIQRLTA